MFMSVIAEYEKALWTPAILPLVLGAIAALLSLYFDTHADSEKNKKKKAWLTFIITGLGGTIVALMSVVNEQENTEVAKAQANQFSGQLQSATDTLSVVTGQLNSTSNQLAGLNAQIASLQNEIANLTEFMTNHPAEIVNNNNYYVAVSNTFATLHKVLVTLNTTAESPEQHEANLALQAKVQDASQFLSSYRNQVNRNNTNTGGVETTNQLEPPPGLHIVPN